MKFGKWDNYDASVLKNQCNFIMRSYYLAKILKKLRLSSFKDCEIDDTAKIDSQCELTQVKIGRFSYICSGAHITNTSIGAFCSLGGNVSIGGGLHPLDMVSTSPLFLKGRNIFRRNLAEFNYDSSKHVEIGNDVWIGNDVYIKSGVTIGDGAVIGAHAVVTRDIEPYAIVVGVPAKLLRYRFSLEIITGLLDMKWWDWPIEKIQSNAQLFNMPEKLIDAAKKGELKP